MHNVRTFYRSVSVGKRSQITGIAQQLAVRETCGIFGIIRPVKKFRRFEFINHLF